MKYFLSSIVFFLLLYLSSEYLVELEVFYVASLLWVLAIPIGLQSAYLATIRQSHSLSIFNEHRWLHKLLSGPLLRLLLGFFFGLFLAFFIVLQLRILSDLEWLILLLAIPLYWLFSRYCANWIADQASKGHREYVKARFATLVLILALLVVYSLAQYLGSESIGAPKPDEFLSPERIIATSKLVSELVNLQEYWLGLRMVAFGELSRFDDWGRLAAVAIYLVGNLSLVSGVVLIMVFCNLPFSELKRVFSSAKKLDTVPELEVRYVAWTSLIFTLLTAFVYYPYVANIENALRQMKPEMTPTGRLFDYVEKIGSALYEEGTIAEINRAKLELVLSSNQNAISEFERGINAGFDHVEANVEEFLDWYYSLPAEYARLGTLLMGDFEAYMDRQISERLSKGDPFGSLQSVLEMDPSRDPATRKIYWNKITEIIQRNSIGGLSPGEFRVTASQPKEFFGIDYSFEAYDLARERLQKRTQVVGASVAGVSALAAAMVSKKLASKGVVKLAAKASIKVATSKVASGGVGGVIGGSIGAAVGSIVPILGTAVGAAAGAAIGAVVAGVSVDALILKLEEQFSRDDFRAELLGPISDARQEMLGLVTSEFEFQPKQ